ncbi:MULTISPECIES: hypothetical protein [unclassified Streptomyces]|uniref:hypothetical protein n=1 Tax=unclassified Streptomyces TaxID=2593676 RepID=UPI001317FC43|nr:hypothetical protein [Streptomyces sp. GS7]QHC22803.1 hypothetical protein GR130_16565 [Streptomyces sp. GS7]
MRKLRKAAVVIAVLGSVGLLGAGPAIAHGGSQGGNSSFSSDGEDGRKGGGKDGLFDVSQGTQCRSHDLNIDVLGAVGVLDGALGNALNGEGASGAQQTRLGSTMGCNNSAFQK